MWRVLERLGVCGNMLAAIKSLYAECLVAIRVAGTYGDSQHPSIGLKQGCPLSATLFGLFIDGLHQYCKMPYLTLVCRCNTSRVTDLIYADDVSLLACTTQHLQVLWRLTVIALPFT